MTISKAYMLIAANAAAGATLTTATFDSTGYTHIVVFTRHDTHSGAAVPSDNKGTTGWSRPIKRKNNANSEWIQFHWAKIGTPGTGHTVTMTTDASATERGVVVWLINATTGVISVSDMINKVGTGTTMTGGNLFNRPGASVVSFSVFSVTTSGTLTEGSGWTNDYETTSIQVQSRGAETTTTIPVAASTNTSSDWACLGISFREGAHLSRAYAVDVYDAATGATTTTPSFDSTGYTHIVVSLRHQTNSDPSTASDNKGTADWELGPVQAVSASTWQRLAWAKLKNPGDGHTVTINTNAAAADKLVGVWLINAPNTGNIELVDTLEASGNTAVDVLIDAGDILNAGAVPVVSFFALNSWIGTHFSDPGTGWADEYDQGIAHYSRTIDTATAIAVEFTLRTLGGNWGIVAAAFRERFARVTLAQDVFQTSIDTGVWNNGHADWGTASWESGGVVSASGQGVHSSLIYTALAWPRSQWSKAVVKVLDGSVNSATIGAMVLASTATDDESCYYGWLSNYSVGGSRYGISEKSSAFGQTDLALGGSRSTPAATENDYALLESDDQGNLTLYCSETTVDSTVEVLRLTTNDTTNTSGRPGIFLYEGNTTNSKAHSWGAGVFVGDVRQYSLDFGGGAGGEDDRQKYYEVSLPQLPNGDWSMGIAVIPWCPAEPGHLSQPTLFWNQVAYGNSGSIMLTHYENAGVHELYSDLWATGDTAYKFLQLQQNSDSQTLIPRLETHFIVLQRRSGNLEMYAVKLGSVVTAAGVSTAAYAGTFPAATWRVGSWEANWPMGEFFCFTASALTPAEISYWASGVPITRVKANPYVYLPLRNGWVSAEPNLGTNGGSATFGGHVGSRHFARSLFDPHSRYAHGYSPDHVRIRTGLRR